MLTLFSSEESLSECEFPLNLLSAEHPATFSSGSQVLCHRTRYNVCHEKKTYQLNSLESKQHCLVFNWKWRRIRWILVGFENAAITVRRWCDFRSFFLKRIDFHFEISRYASIVCWIHTTLENGDQSIEWNTNLISIWIEKLVDNALGTGCFGTGRLAFFNGAFYRFASFFCFFHYFYAIRDDLNRTKQN